MPALRLYRERPLNGKLSWLNRLARHAATMAIL